MADTSVRSTHSNISRGARPESGRLHRKYPYRWLFEQVHVKSLIFHVEVGLLAAAIIGLYKASQMTPDEFFDPIPVPGFDGLPGTGEMSRNKYGVMNRPYYGIARNLINIYSYFLIFSVTTGFLGMRLSETSITRRNFPTRMNPAFLLIPSSISVITFMYPLFVWTLRTVHSAIKVLIKENIKFLTVIDSFRLSLIPIIVIWIIYIYFLYGFWLGVLYYQRRGDPPTPTTHDKISAPFRRPLRRSLIRFQGKAGTNLLSDLTLSSSSPVTNHEHFVGTATAPHHSTSTNCVLSISSSNHSSSSTTIITPTSSSSSSIIPSISSSSTKQKHNRSVSPRSCYRLLETVDEEAQSRTSSEC